MKSKKEICKNCEKTFKEKFKFCPYCGQQAKDKLTVKVLFYNTINNYFSFDARFYKSFSPLLFKPGYLAIKFIEGKRLMYLHPAQMYLFVSIVFFFLFSFVQNEQVKNLDVELQKTKAPESTLNFDLSEQKIDSLDAQFVDGAFIVDSSLGQTDTGKGHHVIANFSEEKLSTMLDPEAAKHKGMFSLDFNYKILDSLINNRASRDIILTHMGMSDDPGFFEKRFYTQALRFYETRRGGRVLQTFYDAIPYAMFILLPIFALILKSLYFKKGLYASYLVFSFYYFSFIFTLFSLFLVGSFITQLPDWCYSLTGLMIFVYLMVAIKNFYKQGCLVTILKTFIVSLVFLLVVMPLTVIVLSGFAFLFY
ncbi:DUF3667 domain-containing protein [Tamlana sp. I1]|uniref:DUF3667 domain-containing protein n=1 Tax=Tamlana sp. I1 TaxID=2762061 RepID=UPI00188F2093|nr:DUF3667 domain-containing protein [Tamlana sp. I1]